MKKRNKVVVEVRGSLNHYRLVATEHTSRKTSAGYPLKFRYGFDQKYRTKALANKAAKELRAFIRSGGDWKSLETAKRFNPRRRKNMRADDIDSIEFKIIMTSETYQAFVNLMFEYGRNDMLKLLNHSVLFARVPIGYHAFEVSGFEAKRMFDAIQKVKKRMQDDADRNRKGRLSKSEIEELDLIDKLGHYIDTSLVSRQTIIDKRKSKNPRKQKNPSKGPVFELNKTTIKALENYFSGKPEYSTMAYLAENAKKKSPSSNVFIFAPTPTFVELLRSELQRVLAYSKFKTDRDFNAIKKLLMQTYDVKFNPKKTTYKQAMESIKKHLKTKGWSISGDYGQKGDFVLVFKKKEIRFGRNYGNKKDNIANAGYPLVGYLIIQDIRRMSMAELDKEIADAQRLFNRPSF